MVEKSLYCGRDSWYQTVSNWNINKIKYPINYYLISLPHTIYSEKFKYFKCQWKSMFHWVVVAVAVVWTQYNRAVYCVCGFEMHLYRKICIISVSMHNWTVSQIHTKKLLQNKKKKQIYSLASTSLSDYERDKKKTKNPYECLISWWYENIVCFH